MSGFNVLFGKMPGPVQKVGKNQLIYDNDLAWEGGTLNYKFPLNDKQEMFINSERTPERETPLRATME
jgi:hypothetical protein